METTALARIEEEIIKQKLILSNLHTQRNRFSFIFRLPDEVLATIFIYCSRNCSNDPHHTTQPRWVKVSYICRHWRNVALNYPLLWSHIPMMPRRWIEEFLARSKKALLKICIGGYTFKAYHNLLEKVMNHAERIQELSLRLPYEPIDEVLSKLSSRAPRLQHLSIFVDSRASKTSPVLFDGDTPALRTLTLTRCPVPWYSLKLNGLTTLSLHYIPVQFQQNTEEFLTTLACMQDLTHLSLVRSLASSRAFISTMAFDTFQNVNLLHVSRLWIDAPLSTVIAFLSCVNIPLNAEVKLECLCADSSSIDDYTPLYSVLARRFSMFEDQALSGPTIRSLIIKSNDQGPKLFFSTLERDCYSRVANANGNIPLQIFFINLMVDEDRIISNICSSLPHIQSLQVIKPPISSAFWELVLGHLEGLRYLKLTRGDMPELASVLCVTPQGCTEKDGPVADGGCHQLFAPALEELELNEITFQPDPQQYNHDSPPPPLGANEESLYVALSTRKDPQIRVTQVDCLVYLPPEVHSSDSKTEGYYSWLAR